MLRSWISAAPARTGVVFDAGKLTAVELVYRRGKAQVGRRFGAPVPGLFEGEPTDAARDALMAALRSWRWRFERAAHVALPDWLGDFRLFALDTVPNEPTAQCDLVRWRFAKELHYDEARIVCTAQPMGEEGASKFLAGVLFDKAWCELIQTAFARSGVPVRTLNLEGALRFNAWHDVVTQSPGAYIDVRDGSWSLVAWDGRRRLRVVRAKRRVIGTADVVRALHGSTAWLDSGAKLDLWTVPDTTSETRDIATALDVELKVLDAIEALPPPDMRALQVACAG